MPKNNTIVNFIPAGARIGVIGETRISKTKKDKGRNPTTQSEINGKPLKNELNDVNSTPLKNESTDVNSTPLKNESTDVNSTHNEMQNISPPKTICKKKSLNSVFCTEYTFSINEDVNENIQTNSPLETTKTEDTRHNVQTTLKDKVYDRLKKSAALKEKNKKHSADNQLMKDNSTEMKHSNGDFLHYNDNDNQSCDCGKCENFANCSVWFKKNLKFNKPEFTKKELPLFRKDVLEAKPTITQKLSNRIILHGILIPKQVSSVDQTCFDENIQKKLRTMNCASAKDMQSYMWPAVLRGLSVFMIGPPHCGKTLSYLPAFCSFCTEKDEKYMELSKYEGPFIIILCSNIANCYELYNSVKTLMSECLDKVITEVLTDDASIQTNCDMMITIPSVLEQAVKTGVVKLERLCHVAIEDAHITLKNYSKNMRTLLKVMDKLQITRPHNKYLQIVVSSQKWSADLTTLLKKLYITPIVCFEDFLEASMYSKVHVIKKKWHSLKNSFNMIDTLKTKYMTHKTVVFCNEEDILKVNELLELRGVECITISHNLIEDEIFVNEEMWNSLQIGHYKVLLCTDAMFEKTVCVLNAQWLIHFCLPTNWTQFEKRFRCISGNLCSPLTVKEDSGDGSHFCSCTITDEFCDNELFENFFNVMTRHATKYLQLE